MGYVVDLYISLCDILQGYCAYLYIVVLCRNSWMKELKTHGKHWMKIENSWKTFNENWKFMENIEWKLCFDLIWNKNSLMTKKNTFIYYLK
jgi:hypothetical protein